VKRKGGGEVPTKRGNELKTGGLGGQVVKKGKNRAKRPGKQNRQFERKRRDRTL